MGGKSLTDLPFSSFVSTEVSRLPGREEAVRVPPSETVAYQRPDHRLRPSAGALLASGHVPSAGRVTDTWLDQKTPDRPDHLPAGGVPESLRHYSLYSSGCQWNQGASFFFFWLFVCFYFLFQTGLRPPTRDSNKKCCPLTSWSSVVIVAASSWRSDDMVNAKSPSSPLFLKKKKKKTNWNAKQTSLRNCIGNLSFLFPELKKPWFQSIKIDGTISLRGNQMLLEYLFFIFSFHLTFIC